MKRGKGKNSKLLPNSLRIISSCLKTVSTNATTVVRSAGASVAATISSAADDRREQVLWAGFDKLEPGPDVIRRVLLLGYQNGFQVFDVEDASSLSELISRRDGPVTFLQMLPLPAKCDGAENQKSMHPVLVVVGGDENDRSSLVHNNNYGPGRYGSSESQSGISVDPPTSVRFYSLRSNTYVKVINFKSAVFMVRCSPRIVAVGLEEQIYCLDSLTLEKKFIAVTYAVPRFGDQGSVGINTGYGPMAVGPRWLAYPPNRPYMLNTGRLSPKNLASSVSPSTSPGSGSLMARYAVESSKQLAAGILTLGDMGYKRLSKYCPELLPDGSNSPGWKGGRLASEPDNAGVVVVKDVISSEVISQFKAHSSPISALCFDPSGTLLVTASVHGNNINIFRIMPPNKRSGSGNNDWSTSYVHLYKLHRGLTSAVIQDICFSHYSQWIAIVSSKGTCHIFALSPFGGDTGLEALNAHGHGTSFPVSSTPWWSTPSFTADEQLALPPPPCTLSVVCRIKSTDSGLFNSVSNAASSLAGKIWVPSGAVAAVFHSSNSSNSANVHSRTSPLEHVLVYTPSGFVVQHELQSSMAAEPSHVRTGTWSGPQVQPQNEEFGVKVEPVQWWDVCRRSDNLEREESISGSIFDGQNDPEIDDDSKAFLQDKENAGEKKLTENHSLKSHDRSHWYLSNAEVQIISCRVPMWQKREVHFHVMGLSKIDLGREVEIEKISSHEVEIRRKDLLPVFNHVPGVRSAWTDRSTAPEQRYPNNLSSDPGEAREKTYEASIISHSKPPSFSSTESSDGGTSRRIENLLDLDHMSIDKSPVLSGRAVNELGTERKKTTNLINPSSIDNRSANSVPYTSEDSRMVDDNNSSMSRSSSSENETPHSDAGYTGSAPDILIPAVPEKKVDFGQFFKEGYYNGPEVETDEVGNRENTNQKEKHDDEEEWIGGVFEFSD